jgi:SAM-dependent methyltransferase
MTRVAYDTLAEVYDWLVPDDLRTPEGAAGAFAAWVADLPPGARVLDCAAGTGQLAVGLALRGFAVTATDASPAMIARTATLAAAHGVDVAAAPCPWERLGEQGWAGSFDAVLCVGNSLAHAPGAAARRAALAAMAGVLRPGGRLVLTSRAWESVRAAGSGLEVAPGMVRRDGRDGLVIRAWTIPAGWDEPHVLDVAVALTAPDGSVETHAERLDITPFTRAALDSDVRAAGLVPEAGTDVHGAERYLVTARRPV